MLNHACILIFLFVCLLMFPHGFTGNSNFYYRKKELEDVNITFYPQPKWSKVDRRYYIMNQSNTHDYRRLINQPNLCSKHEQVFILIAIRTIYSHFQRREILREEYNRTLYINYAEHVVVKHIFLFGRTNSLTTEKLIREESEKYNDIIQEDFVESYVNVSLKAIMAWKWALEFCPNTQYVMVENDEAYVDLDKLVMFLIKDLSIRRTDDHFAVCFAFKTRVSDHLTHAKFTSLRGDQVYQGRYSPSYCHGVAYAAHIDVINKLYKASFTNSPFMPTDVWIGVMAEKLRIHIQNRNYLFVAGNPLAVFNDPDYPFKNVMIVITDWYHYKGKEVTLMRNIHTKVNYYWGRIKNKRYNKIHKVEHTRYITNLTLFICTAICIAMIFIIRFKNSFCGIIAKCLLYS